MELKEKASVLIKNDVWPKFIYLHQENPNIEWCGCIFYKMKGEISKPETIKIEVIDFLLNDIGTSGSTGFEGDISIVKEYMRLTKEHGKIYQGLVHTHHNMNTYFSSVDEKELITNSGLYPQYLSLITNNEGKFIGKIGVETEVVSTHKISSKSFNTEYETSKKELLVINCNLELETIESQKVNLYYGGENVEVELDIADFVSAEFKERCAEFKKKKEKEKTGNKAFVPQNNHSRNYGWDEPNPFMYNNTNNLKFNKHILIEKGFLKQLANITPESVIGTCNDMLREVSYPSLKDVTTVLKYLSIGELKGTIDKDLALMEGAFEEFEYNPDSKKDFIKFKDKLKSIKSALKKEGWNYDYIMKNLDIILEFESK